MKKLLRRNNNNRQDFKEFNDSTDGVFICKDINDGVFPPFFRRMQRQWSSHLI